MTRQIIDAHHHIWRRRDLPWLDGPPVPRIFGAYEAIRRDYLIDEYLADAAPSGVVGSVYVQVNVAPAKEVDEVAWVQSVGEAHGLPSAVVGFADLARPDVGDILDRQRAHARLRGVRQQLHWHPNPQYCYAPRPDVMNDAAWRRGLKAVEARGLLFELQVFADQMRDATRLAQDFPDVTFVLLHAGMLEDRGERGWALWRRGMRALASCPNVVTKLSGLGTFLRRCAAAEWRPVIAETIALFGPQRCMFGSNFPIEKLWTSYAEVVAATEAGLAALHPDERHEVFYGTAARLYRLD